MQKISNDQMLEMKHALGFHDDEKIIMDKSYRNRFYTNHNSVKWNDLVKKELANKSRGWEEDMAYFHVTDKGIKLLLENYNDK